MYKYLMILLEPGSGLWFALIHYFVKVFVSTMQQDTRMQELLEAVGPYELQTVDAHGLERLVIVIQGQ